MTSLADSLASTGPVSGSDLQPDATNQNKPKPTSEASLVAEDQKGIESSIKKLDSLKPPPPPQFKEAPKAETSDPVQQGYVSAIGIMGAIGSAFTRKPMVNSMNSAAAVLKSMKEGDQESFKQNMEKWKIDNENIKALSDYQQSIYKDILENTKIGIDEKMGLLQAHAAAFKDDGMMALSQQKNDIDAQHLILDRKTAQKNWDKQSTEIEKAATENQARNMQFKMLQDDFKAGKITPEKYKEGLQEIATGKAASTATTGKKGLESVIADPSSTDEERKDAVKRLEDMSTAEKAGSIRGAQAMLISQYKKEHPDATTEELEKFLIKYTGQSAASRKIASLTVNMDAANGLLNKSLPLLIDRFKAVDNSQFADINSFQNYLKQHTNDQNLVRLNEALLTTESDLALLIRRGGSSTVDAQNRAHNVINNLMSTKSAEAFKTQVLLEADRAKSALHDVEDETYGDEDKESFNNEDKQETPPVEGARKAPDGNWYVDDPKKPGRYLKVGK